LLLTSTAKFKELLIFLKTWVCDLQVTVTDLCKMKLKRIVGGEGDEKAASEEFTQRIAMITEKQWIVAERRHGDADLCNVIQILKNWTL